MVKAVVLLRRDAESPAEVSLTSDEALAILEEGKYQVLSGAGGNIGEFKKESYYNPYLLVKRPDVQARFFQGVLFLGPGAYIEYRSRDSRANAAKDKAHSQRGLSCHFLRC